MTGHDVEELVRKDLEFISQPDLVQKIRHLLVTPYAIDRAWDYGQPGEAYVCWTVLEHRDSNTGIAYCEKGFGPLDPWGLVILTGQYMSIGMDSSWFPSLESAMRESMAWDGVNPAGYEVP